MNETNIFIIASASLILNILDIVELEAKLRLQPDRSRILGASRVWNQDWGSLESNVALEDVIQPFAMLKGCLVLSWSERSECSDENPVR